MKQIDYYGQDADYIHLKFGNALKMYYFTKELKEKYPRFYEEYLKYWNGEHGRFKNAYTVLKYIQDFDIPVHLYLNFTDTPVTVKEAIKWWFDNNTLPENLDK